MRAQNPERCCKIPQSVSATLPRREDCFRWVSLFGASVLADVVPRNLRCSCSGHAELCLGRPVREPAVRPPGQAVQRGPPQGGGKQKRLEGEPRWGRGDEQHDGTGPRKPLGTLPRGCDGPGLRADMRCPGSGQLGLLASVERAPPRAQRELSALPRSSPPTPRRPPGPPACPSTGRRPPAAPGPRAPSSATCPRPTHGSR